jgi:regulator of protease activity HflC (stomatin/prohibitin superfamily)
VVRQVFKEEMEVFMPKDKMKLRVEVRGTLSVPTSEAYVNQLFDRLTAAEVSSRVSLISANLVYGTYGKQGMRGVVRSELVKYSINEILEQRETIGENIHAAVVQKLRETKTPLLVSRFELASVLPPDVIVLAQQAAKEREIDIQQAEADAQVQMVEAEKALEVAKKDRLVARENAEAIAEQNRIAADSVTPELLAYRRIEAAERIYASLAASSNVIIVPADSGTFDSLTDDAVLAKMLGRELK